MTLDAWLTFASFWAIFVVSPGPNAVNCVSNGMTFGLPRALWGVAAILCQALLFLTLAAAGVTAALAAMPEAVLTLKALGGAMLIWLGLRGIRNAALPIPEHQPSSAIFGRALAIATFNVKSLMGYLAAFTQFIDPKVGLWSQMGAIYPTALTLTALAYLGWTGLGVWLGRQAMGAAHNIWFRRFTGACFVAFGAFLVAGASQGL